MYVRTSIESNTAAMPLQSTFSKCSSTANIGFLGSEPARRPLGYPRILVFKYKILGFFSKIENL